MSELIKITETKNGQVVSARELFEYLDISERFSRWFERMASYGFENGLDYTPYQKVHPMNNQDIDDYALTLDTAKEIAMLQKSEKGKEIRKYFIESEKKLRNVSIPSYQIEDSVLRAQKWIQEQEVLKLAQSKIEQDKPKVVFADSVIGSSNSILIRQFAKDLCDDEFEIGQNRLFDWFRDNGYLNTNNEPYQNYIAQGLFEVVTRTVGSGIDTFTTKTTKITGKGQVYFAKKIKQSQ